MKNFKLHQKITENEISQKYNTLLAQLAHNRNIQNLKVFEAFIFPQYEKNFDPFLLKDIEKSINRIHTAIKENQKITVYADYDADGVPGSVIAAQFLEKLGHTNFDIYIPHRHSEGYGLHIAALEKILASGTELVITIDLGITAYEAAQWCKERDLDLIISDHHLPLFEKGNEKIPQAFAVINPKQKKCEYPDSMLCGTGVMYKIIQAFLKEYAAEYNIHEGWEKWLLDMVGISTISDLVPLQKENRIFAYYGMKVFEKVLRQGKIRPGLHALAESSSVHPDFFTEEDIAFSITPKINAASRMSHPVEAAQTFMAENISEAQESARHLTKLNDTRKKLVKETMEHAEALLLEKNTKELNIISIGHESWNAGIIGLVASKLVEKYHKPVFVWAQEGNTIKGSCRTWNGIHLVKIMELCAQKTFKHFGGHKEAGGFSCEVSEVLKLEKRLQSAHKKYQKESPNQEKEYTHIDMKLSIDEISSKTYHELRKMAPFGMGNPKPLFLFKKVVLSDSKNFGKEKNHLEVSFKNSFGKNIRGIFFFKTKEDFPVLQRNIPVDIVAHIDQSFFAGRTELRLSLVEIAENIE